MTSIVPMVTKVVGVARDALARGPGLHGPRALPDPVRGDSSRVAGASRFAKLSVFLLQLD